MRWTVRVVVLTKVAISEDDKPSSYLLCMRARRAGQGLKRVGVGVWAYHRGFGW